MKLSASWRIQTYINTQKNYLSQCDQNKTFSLVDLWIGNEGKEKIGQILKREITGIRPRSFSASWTDQDDKSGRYKDKYARSRKALIKIQEGCDNFCSYCIVPYVRGRSRSRYADEIIDEINRLVKEGIEEIVLTGIDIASFKFQISNNKFQTNYKSQITKHKNNIVRLIKLILAETKIKKISFGSMGLDVFDDEFIALYSEKKLRLSDERADFDTNFSSVSKLALTASATDNKIQDKDLAQVVHMGRRRLAQTEADTQKNCVSSRGQKPSHLFFNNEIPVGFQPRQALAWAGPRPSGIPIRLAPAGTMRQYSNRLSSHFHIPLQSGCDSVLKRMKRKYTTESFIKTIKKLKKEIPNFSFSTDIIVGFPGETIVEFKKTVRVIREIREILGKSFKKIHVFRYSSREGTLAEKMEGNKGWERVDEKEKKRRARIISNF